MSKVGFKMIHWHNYATWELKIVKFSNFGQNHFSDFETPFSVGLVCHISFWLGQTNIYMWTTSYAKNFDHTLLLYFRSRYRVGLMQKKVYKIILKFNYARYLLLEFLFLTIEYEKYLWQTFYNIYCRCKNFIICK